MAVKLLPRKIDQLSARQVVEHAALDRMKNASRLAGLRDEVEPSAGRHVTFSGHPKNVRCDRVAVTEAVEQPAIEISFFECLLYWFDQSFLRQESGLN